MYLRWFQPIDEFGVERNRWVEEIWQRVLIEDLEVSNVDLRQELRTLFDKADIALYGAKKYETSKVLRYQDLIIKKTGEPENNN